MDDLSRRIEQAKTDCVEMNALVSDYMPFIKSEISKTGAAVIEYDDRLSLGMLVFMNSVKQYNSGRGGFLQFASVCIRNRILDECRLRAKDSRNISFEEDTGKESHAGLEAEASLNLYNRHKEQRALAEEIQRLNKELSCYNISFEQLSKKGPKQKRSRRQCIMLARQIISDSDMKSSVLDNKRIPQTELAEIYGISEKTIEKHRRYIVALCVILAGEYPGIAAFAAGSEVE